MIFMSGEIIVRKLEDSDADFLVKWLSDPKILEFYEGRDRPHDLEMVNSSFLKKKGDPVTGCIVLFEGKEIGYIQFYPLEEEERLEYGYSINENIYGLDQFIGEPEYWSRGIGTRLITEMVNYLINQFDAKKVVMDPQTWNERALRCYEKCGFKKIKLLPQHEMHEGVMRDCWLIEYDRGIL